MDPFAPALATLQAAIALALLFLLPGLTWGPLLAPASAAAAAAGRSVGVSLLVSSATCTLLAWAGVLRAPVVIAALVAVTLVPLAAPSGRHEIGRRLRTLRRAGRRRRRWWLGALGGIGIAAALVVLPSRLQVGEALLPFTSTVWYYAGLARSVAELGGLPAGQPEWGAVRDFQLDYLPVTAHAAAALQLLPGDLLVQLETYRLALLVAALATGYLVFRRWVSSWAALLGAVLLLATVRLDFKFLAYKPETFGLVLVLLAAWAADRAIVERSARTTLLAVGAATLAFLSHAETFLLLGPALLGIAAARLVVAPGRGRLGLRLPAPRRAAVALAIAAAVFGGGLASGSGANVLLTGHLRILGYLAGDRADGGTPPPPADEVPLGWIFSGDPTWDFYVAAVAPAQVGSDPPTRFLDARLLPRSVVAIWSGLDGRDRSLLVVLAGLVGAPLAGWPWLDARRRRLVVTWWLFGVALLAGAYLLFALSGTYVPRRTGPQRLVPYELLVPVAAAVAGLWAIDRLLRPGWRALLPVRGAMAAAGLALALLTAGAVAPAETDLNLDREPGLTAAGYEAYRWSEANLPPDARILANAYTDGSLAAISRRTGIVDGRAVYLEERQLLAESTALLLGARVLFADPDGPAAATYLARQRVDYLLVAAVGATGSDLGGYDPFPTDLAALLGSDRYTLLRTFGGGRLLLFEVRLPPTLTS